MPEAEIMPPPAELLSLMSEARDCVVATHRGPDGDALGGSLALALALRDHGKHVQVVASTVPGDHYLWLPGMELVGQEVTGAPEVALVVDCDSLSRLDHLQAPIEACRVVVHLDHHSGEPYGHISYVDSHAAAACCVVHRLLTALEWEITPDMATCLYTGLVTDTGFFRFENTNPEVLRLAAALVARGAPPSRIADLVSERRPLRRWQLAGRALAALQATGCQRVVWSVLHPEDYAATGCNAADTESIIDLFKQTERQEVCVLFKTPRDPAKWQVSLRSRSVDVACIAREYGGGGHARAAGFDFHGELEPLRADLLARLQEALGQEPAAS